MKVQQLEKLVVKTQHDLLQAQLKAVEFEKQFRAAKAKNRRAKHAYKLARRAARKTKKLASAAAEQAGRQQRAFAKARKRLAKAWKKIGLLKTVPKMRPPPRPKLLTAPKRAPVPAAASVSVNLQGKLPAALLPRRPENPAASALGPTQSGTVL